MLGANRKTRNHPYQRLRGTAVDEHPVRPSPKPDWRPMKMSRNGLYAIIAVLAVVVGVVGYQYYQERQNTAGIEIKIGKDGITVETD